ncbi:MAG: hypothetical protein SEPTF4163_000977 [Sporothrix epigloea]
MSDEPSLPRFPPSVAAGIISGPGRKRVRRNIFDTSGARSLPPNQLLFNNSSDPAVFSSDDDPALDNYVPYDSNSGSATSQFRRKNRYVGSWFAQHPQSSDSAMDGGEASGHDGVGGSDELGELGSPGGGHQMTLSLLSSPPQPRCGRKRRTFERQFDSGVYMDRETTTENDDNVDDAPDAATAGCSSPSHSRARDPPSPTGQANSAFLPLPARQQRVFQRVPSLAVDSIEQKARVIIQECIEFGDDRISLIGLGLTALSNATIEPLSGLVPIPVVTAGVAFEQKDPKLKVFLSSNNLTRLPGALFQLEHLTVLSLRGNGLVELPPAIGQLRNLKSLNVSLNKLQTLPAELLPLIRTSGKGGLLTELLLYPNPYLFPDIRSQARDREDYENYKKKIRYVGDAPTRVARSVVHYMDSWGKTCSQFSFDPENHTIFDMTPIERLSVQSRAPQMAADAPKSVLCRVPTLVSLALEACYRASQLTMLPHLLPPEAPLRIRRQLEKALLLRDSGGSTCAVCSQRQSPPRPMVAPMTAWVEWWEFGKPDINKTTSLSTPTAEDPQQRVPLSRERREIDMVPFLSRGCTWGCLPSVEESKG